MSDPAIEAPATGALEALSAKLAEDPELAAHVTEPADSEATLGDLAARGPTGSRDRVAYAVVIEAVLEGFLLHRGRGRLIAGEDEDLALLAGDYLYALAIERLAGLDDGGAVQTLATLISTAAQARAERREEAVPELWLAGACAVGWGRHERFEAAAAAQRDGAPGAAAGLVAEAEEAIGSEAAATALTSIRETVGFQPRRAENGT